MGTDAELPEPRTTAAIERHDGARVAIVGTYRQVDMNAHPRGDPEYVGHVGVELADTLVHLGPTWDAASKRADDEIERLEGERVRAIGTIQAEMIEPPEERFMFVGPCLHPVESVRRVE